MPSFARYIGIGSLGADTPSTRLVDSPFTCRRLPDALPQSGVREAEAVA
jgi:hypothetical protein